MWQANERGRRDAHRGRTGNSNYTDVKNARAFRAGWKAVKFARTGAGSIRLK